jgi:hypothetical protein
MLIEQRTTMLSIDRQARAWQRRLVECWCGHTCPRLYRLRDALTAALLLHHGLWSGPLPDGRLELVYAATRREEPSRHAFVTLAVIDYVEDLEAGVSSAHLPYQLAWARAGRTLSERTGMPGGILRARWPDALEFYSWELAERGVTP